MKTRTFKGGVHPLYNKQLTSSKPIEEIPHPQKVFIPLQQHAGAPCEPLVKVGDEVKVGQKIGESKSFISAPIHASISGKVVAIEPYPHPVLPTPVNSIIIENGGEPSSFMADSYDWHGMDPEEIKNKIREAGIVGLGGAAFPTHVKLSPPSAKKIDSLIINGAECEPYLTNDHRLMLEKPREIIEGAKIILKTLGINRAYIGIEVNKTDAIKAMKDISNSQEFLMEVIPLKVKYPQGAEKQLIKTILNREVPSGGLPFDVGVVVHNVGTAFAIYEAVANNKPLFERVITVSGNGIKEPKNVRVRLGTPFSRVIDYCGGFNNNGDLKVIMGGPMMGLTQYTLDVPVIKGTSGIIVIERSLKAEKEGSCIRCGRCVEVCPMYLMPYRIADYAEKDNFVMCNEYGVRDCTECGACAYICTARRPIVHLIKYAKLSLTKKTKHSSQKSS